MSKIKKRIGFVILFALVSFFAFGCRATTNPVENIYFNLGDEQVVLLKGDELNLKNHIVFLSYPKAYLSPGKGF